MNGHLSKPVNFDELQAIVGGLIQAIYPYNDPVALILNDEGKEPVHIFTGAGCTGDGLGMAISDQMVRLMGGQIVVESQPDVGSEFTVFLSLPVASAPQEEAPQKQPAQIEPVSRPMRLLMAEDNEINAMIAVEILQERGAQIEVAENGKIAEEKFAASPAGYYDAVLMDVQMPVMDGRAAARSIRAMPRPDTT